ncbi:hypothetical protein M8J77_021905 [Diaphorina citri]|nr:hypothetical protein M8J77_021905 [Diaphorina citri]
MDKKGGLEVKHGQRRAVREEEGGEEEDEGEEEEGGEEEEEKEEKEEAEKEEKKEGEKRKADEEEAENTSEKHILIFDWTIGKYFNPRSPGYQATTNHHTTDYRGKFIRMQ